jgi:DNA gyrase inhibitor GyrI
MGRRRSVIIFKVISQNMPRWTEENHDRMADVPDRIKEKLPDESRSSYCVSNSPDSQLQKVIKIMKLICGRYLYRVSMCLHTKYNTVFYRVFLSWQQVSVTTVTKTKTLHQKLIYLMYWNNSGLVITPSSSYNSDMLLWYPRCSDKANSSNCVHCL